LQDSFAENLIPKVHSYVFIDASNVVAHSPSPIWTEENEMNDLEEESNQTLEYFSESSHMVEKEYKNYEQDFILSYTPYEYILKNMSENEIEEPPPNA
jgi:hypothetical protein